MKTKRFSFHRLIKSFVFAFNGLKILFHEEHHSRTILVSTLCVVAAGWYFQVSRVEWLGLVFAIGLVVSVELINSVIENLADFVSPQKHSAIKKIKDLSAAAVLVSAMTACIIGILIFVPKFL